MDRREFLLDAAAAAFGGATYTPISQPVPSDEMPANNTTPESELERTISLRAVNGADVAQLRRWIHGHVSALVPDATIQLGAAVTPPEARLDSPRRLWSWWDRHSPAGEVSLLVVPPRTWQGELGRATIGGAAAVTAPRPITACHEIGHCLGLTHEHAADWWIGDTHVTTLMGAYATHPYDRVLTQWSDTAREVVGSPEKTKAEL